MVDGLFGEMKVEVILEQGKLLEQLASLEIPQNCASVKIPHQQGSCFFVSGVTNEASV